MIRRTKLTKNIVNNAIGVWSKRQIASQRYSAAISAAMRGGAPTVTG
ncbi:MAG TPA: hypothetical protein PK344_11890 [Syntrophorhabdaceae bacterium]|nr:hypothetical protein [Syntrophorhabdaceae bacterium]